jgi:hypothetical protein
MVSQVPFHWVGAKMLLAWRGWSQAGGCSASGPSVALAQALLQRGGKFGRRQALACAMSLISSRTVPRLAATR